MPPRSPCPGHIIGGTQSDDIIPSDCAASFTCSTLFKKKSRQGIKTPLNEIEKINSRLKNAETLHRTALESKNEKAGKHKKQR
jgi:hypothetical protein